MASVSSASAFFGAGSGGPASAAGTAPAATGLGTGLAAFQNLLGSLLGGDEAMLGLSSGDAQPALADGALLSGDGATPAGSFMISLPGTVLPATLLDDAAGSLLTLSQAGTAQAMDGAGILFSDAAAAALALDPHAGGDDAPAGRAVTIAITEITETIQITEITLAGPAPVLEIVPPAEADAGAGAAPAADTIAATLFPATAGGTAATARIAMRTDVSELTVVTLASPSPEGAPDVATDAPAAPPAPGAVVAQPALEAPVPAVTPGAPALPADGVPAPAVPAAPVTAAPDAVIRIAVELPADAAGVDAVASEEDAEADAGEDEESDDSDDPAGHDAAADAALLAAAFVTPVPQPVADAAPPADGDDLAPALPALGSGPARPAAAPPAPKAPAHTPPGAALPEPELAADEEPAPAKPDAKHPKDAAAPTPMPEAPARAAAAPTAAAADGPDQAPGTPSSTTATAPSAASADTGANPDMTGQDGSRHQASGGTEQIQHAGGVDAPRAASSSDFASHLASARQSHGASGGPPQPATHQVAVQLNRAVVDGQDHLRIQLRPMELGRIDVQLQIADGRVSAQITADNASTLELLQRDSRGLEKALQDAGLQTDSGSLSFNLRDSGRQAHDNSGARNPGAGSRFTLDAPVDTPDDDLPLPRLVPAGRVDVRV